MKREDIHTLLEKYFDGLTSLNEEQMLRDYFSQDEIENELRVHQPLFRFFAAEIGEVQPVIEVKEEPTRMEINIPKTKSVSRPWIRWTAIGAAACLALVLSIQLFFVPSTLNLKKSYAYVDGKKYTDVTVVQQQALESLETFSDSDNDVLSSQIEMLDGFFD